MESKLFVLVVFAITAHCSFALPSKSSSIIRTRTEDVSSQLQRIQTQASFELDNLVYVMFNAFYDYLTNPDASITDDDKFEMHANLDNGFGAILGGAEVFWPEAGSDIETLLSELTFVFMNDILGPIASAHALIENASSTDTQAEIDALAIEAHSAAKKVVESIYNLIRNYSSGLKDATKATIDLAESETVTAVYDIYQTPFDAINASLDAILEGTEASIEKASAEIKVITNEAYYHMDTFIQKFFSLYKIINRDSADA